MIQLEIKDTNGKPLTLDSKIRMICEDTEKPIGEVSGVRLVLNDNDAYEIRAFEEKHMCKIISNGMYAQEFVIVE